MTGHPAGSVQKPSVADFREAMARLSAAVHVVTTDGPAGRAGLTVSSVCSVTDEPPTLLVCLNRASRANALFKTNGVLAVNTLRAGQEDVSALFSRRDASSLDRFAAGSWDVLATGSPVLRDSLISFDCRITEVMEVGTHSVLFGEIESLVIGDHGPALVYYNRAYRAVHRGD